MCEVTKAMSDVTGSMFEVTALMLLDIGPVRVVFGVITEALRAVSAVTYYEAFDVDACTRPT
jgi:hypothetical protein